MKRILASAAAATVVACASSAAASAAPGGAHVSLSPYRVGGRPPLVLAGQGLSFRGYVSPYVAGQRVSVTLVRSGRTIASARATVAAAGRRGRFTVRFAVASTGPVHADVVHVATAAQGAFRASSRAVQVVRDVVPGERSQSVRVLQWELAALHFAVPLNGVFEEATGHALIAYRKSLGLARVAAAGPRVFAALEHGRGEFRVRFPGDGRHIEANLALQLLAEIEPGGRVREVYTMSSGKPSTPTVLGRFHVYRREPGVNSEGMVDSNYFIRGYAIHGYPEVPTWPASHGCLRVPIPDAPSIFAWIRLGTTVDVYY